MFKPLKYEIWSIDEFSYEGCVVHIADSEDEAKKWIANKPSGSMHRFRIIATATPNPNGYYEANH